VARFLVDENLPILLAIELSSRGLSSMHVSDTPALRSAPDDEIVAYAAREGLVLITKDKELSFITRFTEAAQHGIVSVRIRESMSVDDQVRIVVAAITSLNSDDLPGSVIVVEPGRVRVRRGKGR
jgi:predicted nuclease of predicted toxin-antitoxin system